MWEEPALAKAGGGTQREAHRDVIQPLSPLATPCQALAVGRWGDREATQHPSQISWSRGKQGATPDSDRTEGRGCHGAGAGTQRSLGIAYQGGLLEEVVSELSCIGRVELGR